MFVFHAGTRAVYTHQSQVTLISLIQLTSGPYPEQTHYLLFRNCLTSMRSDKLASLVLATVVIKFASKLFSRETSLLSIF